MMDIKLDKTFIFIKNYAVIFISNAYVCNLFYRIIICP